MNDDNILKLILVGLCTVGLGAVSIGGCAMLKQREKQKRRAQHDPLER